MKICIACSAGGHLVEALQLMPILKSHKVFFITVDRPQSRERLKKCKAFFIEDTKRSPHKLTTAFFQNMKILRKEKPTVIISTGAAAAVPALFAGKILGAKIVYIESIAAVNRPASAGKVAYTISDLFIVQWRSLLKFYKKAVYGGQLI
jgi:beta-1,4-N-acetylglucosaminyltransferase